MKDPDRAFEKKVLLDIVEQMKDTADTERTQATLRKAIYSIGAAGLVMGFFLAIKGLAHAISVAFVAGFSGCAIEFGLFLDFAQKRWPITRKHVDMNSVRKRLDELRH
jgi:flagellar motor component MotA